MSNLHLLLDEANKHTPKGFDNVGAKNFRPWKDELSESTFTENFLLPRAINFVDGTVAAPTSANGDIYVLTGAGVIDASWGLSTFGDWTRATNTIFTPITPIAGTRCFDSTSGTWKEFNGSNWVAGDANTTNLAVANITATNLDVTSDTGTDATLPAATVSDAGLMPAAKFNEVVVNNGKDSRLLIKEEGGAALTTRTNLNFIGASVTATDNAGTDSTDITIVAGSASGAFAIFDSVGVPTYYTTLALAFAAASAGDVVQQFADVEDLTAEITVPLNVHWNLNGHEYKKTEPTNTSQINILANSTNKITNGRITSEGTAAKVFNSATSSHVYGDGLTITCNGNYTILGFAGAGSISSHFYNMTIISTSTTTRGTRYGTFENCKIIGKGTQYTCYQPYDMDKCYVTADNAQTINAQIGHASHCTVISFASWAFGSSCRASNCYIRSYANSATGIFTTDINNCVLVADAGGVEIYTAGAIVRNSTIKAVSGGFGLRTSNAAVIVRNCTIENSAGQVIEVGANSEWVDNTIVCDFNSSVGHAAKIANGITAGNEPEVTNCTFKISHASANYLNAAAATRANYKGLSSFDKLVVVTPVHGNITQAVLTISDAQGNNL